MPWRPRPAGPLPRRAARLDGPRLRIARARLGALLLLVGSAVVLLTLPVVSRARPVTSTHALIALAEVAVGYVALQLRWERLNPRYLVLVPVTVLVLAALPVADSAVRPLELLPLYAVVFAYAGLTQCWRGVLALVPVAVVSGVVRTGGGGDGELVLLPELVAAAAVLGLGLSGWSAAYERSVDRYRRLIAGTRRLGRAATPAEVAREVGETLLALAGADLVLATGDAAAVYALARPGRVGASLLDGVASLDAEDLQRLGAGAAAEGSPVWARRPLPVAVPGLAEEWVLSLGDDGGDGWVLVGWRRPARTRAWLFDAELWEVYLSAAAPGLALRAVPPQTVATSAPDPLTGLPGRTAVQQRLRALRPDQVVAVFDVDGLGDVNRRGGRCGGDDLLRGLAACLVAGCGPDDWCGRLGSDEFVVVLAGTDEHASEAVHAIRQRWAADRTGATLSVGMTVHDADTSPFQTLDHALAVLDVAKISGGDRITSIGLRRDQTTS